MRNEPNNRQRSLGRIAVGNAWFDAVPTEGPPRYRFHMDVSFREERLGGEADDPVRFRVALLRCEVSVVLPAGEAELVIDPRTIASDRAGTTVSRSRERVSTREAGGGASLEVGPTGASAAVEGRVRGGTTMTETAVTRGETALLLGQRSQTRDGDLSWVVTRADGSGILDQVVWDARAEPRFDLIDRRDAAVRDREARTQLHPTVRVEVHCRSEDLQITEIALTDPDERRKAAVWAGTGSAGRRPRPSSSASYCARGSTPATSTTPSAASSWAT